MSSSSSGSRDRPWIPRFWDGMTAGAWFSLVARNHAHISFRCWGMALIISAISVLNSLLGLLQRLVFGRRIASTALVEDPIFVIGHWRTGTTLLHELLILDDRTTYPDTYDCFAPAHFLVSGWFFRPVLKFLLPSRRPTDNMAAGWDRPQEDEFALCNLGARSPYLTISFPNHPPQDEQYFSLDDVSPADLRRWQQKWLGFLKCLTIRKPKQIVLKSPPHTFRIRVLLEMFPRARFVHIVRNPYETFPSTVKLWKRLYYDQGLQIPRYEGLEEYVLATFQRMYEVFQRDRHLIPAGQFCEVRYEDLVRDPVEQMRIVYDRLQLGDFSRVAPALERYFADQADYKTNQHQLSPLLADKIRGRWKTFFEQYGYAAEAGDLPSPVAAGEDGALPGSRQAS